MNGESIILCPIPYYLKNALSHQVFVSENFKKIAEEKFQKNVIV